MIQVVSLAAAVLLLFAYGANQLGRLESTDVRFPMTNLVASAILAYVALVEQQWGFLLLEGAWVILSVVGLWRIRSAAGRPGRS